MKYFKILIIILLFSSSFLISQVYYVNTEKLNLREKPNSNSKILEQLKKGDEITFVKQENQWIEVLSKENNKGYVNKKFLSKTSTNKQIVLGFKSAFKKYFTISFFYGFFIIAAIDFARNKRIKDRRFKDGYRKLDINYGDIIKYALISLPFSLIIGLAYGIYHWLK